MVYSDEEIQAARQLIQDLESFTNRDISHIANIQRVTDKSRRMVITDLVILEFGQDILSKRIYKPFGDDTLTRKVSYRNDNTSRKSDSQN